jgi:hypothetical protein
MPESMNRLIRAQSAERRQRPQRGVVTQSEPEPEAQPSFDGGVRRPPPSRQPVDMNRRLRGELAGIRLARELFHND